MKLTKTGSIKEQNANSGKSVTSPEFINELENWLYLMKDYMNK